MEFAAAFVGSVTEPIRNVSIRHLGYIVRYKRHVKELKQRVDDLEIQRQTVQREVSDAEKNVQEIKANVKDWLEKVDTEIKKSQDFYDEAATKTGCSWGILPFLRNRHKLGKQAKEVAAYVLELRKDGSTFGGVSHPPTQTPAVTALSNDGYVKLQSRQNTMEEIMRQLKDSTVRMIGVHGPGGVGKTALVKEIAKEAKGNKLFDVVVMLDITRNPNRQEIQQEIAYPLGLTFEREGENVRADRLRSRLKQAKENILVILDDLWDEFDLNMLGIIFDDDDLGHMTVQGEKDNFGHKMARKEKSPGDYDGKSRATFDDRVKVEKDFSYKMVNNEDSPGVYKGCKILLTSRIKEVLSDKMNVKENSIFYVTELNNEEVETLFNNVVEIPDENSKFKLDLVKKYCAGLPMAIRTVGRALRNESESVWEDALKKHKQELMGMHKPMEISVRMSYEHLESEELKSIFLLCAQMGQQPLIVDLVKYCFGLGILKGVHTLTDARDRISKLIQKLKDSSLISDGNSSNHFNMHDMVQDAALSIAHKDQNVFTLRNDKLDDWPDKDELEKCTSISIYKMSSLKL